MAHLKDSIYYHQAIKIVEYSFGSFFLFDEFIVSEINEGVTFTWEDHAKQVVEELTDLYEDNGKGKVYISNRVHSFSVKPSDWLKFFRSNYNLKAYCIVSYNKPSFITSLIEKLFMKSTFKTFHNIEDAIIWAKKISDTDSEIVIDS